MGVLIRSQGGQRSYTLLGNKNKNKKDAEKEQEKEASKEPQKELQNELRQAIIEVLKGLTFNFELKIADVIETSLSVSGDNLERQDLASQLNISLAENSNQDDLPSESFVHKTSVDLKSDSIKNISDKLAAAYLNDYRPPKSSTLSQREPAREEFKGTLEKSSDESPTRSTLGGDGGAVESARSQAPTKLSSLSFAPIQALRKRATDTPTTSSVTKPVQQQPDEPTATNNHLLSPRSARIEMMRQIKAKIDKEPVPVKTKLRRGQLPVGETVQTVLASQEGKEVFVTYSEDDILSITEKLTELTEEIQQQPSFRVAKVDDIVVAKSANDGGWYRGVISEVHGTSVKVNFFDWGMSETLNIADVKESTHSDLSIMKTPACAVRVTLLNADQAPDDTEFKIRVESYDEYEETYQVTLL